MALKDSSNQYGCSYTSEFLRSGYSFQQPEELTALSIRCTSLHLVRTKYQSILSLKHRTASSGSNTSTLHSLRITSSVPDGNASTSTRSPVDDLRAELQRTEHVLVSNTALSKQKKSQHVLFHYTSLHLHHASKKHKYIQLQMQATSRIAKNPDAFFVSNE